MVHSVTNQTGGPEPNANCSPHNTKLPPSCTGCASALLHRSDGHMKIMIPSPSKHRIVPSCLNQFKLCSHLSDPGTEWQISLLALSHLSKLLFSCPTCNPSSSFFQNCLYSQSCRILFHPPSSLLTNPHTSALLLGMP